MSETKAKDPLVRRYEFLDEKSPEETPANGDMPNQEPIEWQRELLVQFLKNQIRVTPAMPILALLLAITSLQWTSLGVAAGWLVAAFACQGIQTYLCKTYFNRSRSKDEQGDWIGLLSASELLTGVCWFLPLFLFWNEAGPMQQIYLIASVMVVIAVRLLIVNSFMPVLIAGTGVLTVGCSHAPLAGGDL